MSSASGADTFTEASATRGRVRAAQAQVAENRGLPFLREVEVQVETPAQVRAHLDREVKRELDVRALEGTEALWRLLDLVPPGFDLLPAWLAILEENVGGYYDPDDKRLVLVNQGSDLPAEAGEALRALEDMVISHELVHALQDQHFDLRSRTLRRRVDGDASLAMQALIEGDASYAMLSTLLPGLDVDAFPASALVAAVGASGGPSSEMGGAMGAAPSILREPLLFSYLAGLGFVHALRQPTRTFTPIDEAFRNPPLSTEHILHPERYQGHDDPPIRLDAPGARRWLAGARLLTEDTVGEYGIRLVLTHHGAIDPADAAVGWGGDRAWVWRDGDAERAVWFTTWDTVADASAFAEEMNTIAATRPWMSIQADDQDVIVWLGVPAEDRASLAASLQKIRRTPVHTWTELDRRRAPGRKARGAAGG